MISAVQSESSALDNMRDRVRELDGMKEQMNKLTRKLLESDQLNITLKVCSLYEWS